MSSLSRPSCPQKMQLQGLVYHALVSTHSKIVTFHFHFVWDNCSVCSLFLANQQTFCFNNDYRMKEASTSSSSSVALGASLTATSSPGVGFALPKAPTSTPRI
jgi:hypothetical protein